jgi:hypothetical protein
MKQQIRKFTEKEKLTVKAIKELIVRVEGSL